MRKSRRRPVGMCTPLSAALLLLLATGCEVGLEEDADDASLDTSEAGGRPRAVPTITVSPNPVEAGSIAATNPTVIGSGFARGKTYSITVIGQWYYDSVTADSAGNFVWPIQQSLGVVDVQLSAPTFGPLVVLDARDRQLASTTLQVVPNPGTCDVGPRTAPSGAPLTVSGSGASPGASLEASWFDITECTCWLYDCCTWTANSATLTADSSGSFATSISSVSYPGTGHSMTIQDQDSGSIVASCSFATQK